MNKRLNVSVIQMPLGEPLENLAYLKTSVERLMKSYVKPELVIGVEYGISNRPLSIPGPVTTFLGSIARTYGIYFIPGTMAESSGELPDGQYYNTCPVFGPDGRLLAAYRKKIPFCPGEAAVPSKNPEVCIFEIPEKDIKVGVLICYEQFFPEIPRALAMEGAELMICPALDPLEYRHIPDILPRARALENEVFYIWTCGSGTGAKGTLCGSSVIVDPEGEVVYKCGQEPCQITLTLDLEQVKRKRFAGRDQHLNSLRAFTLPKSYAGNLEAAPVYHGMLKLTRTPKEYAERLKELGLAPIQKTVKSEQEDAATQLEIQFQDLANVLQ